MSVCCSVLSCPTPLSLSVRTVLSIIIGGHVHSQTLRMCRTVAALSNPLMREALIGCSGGRIRSLDVAGTKSSRKSGCMILIFHSYCCG